MIEQRSTNSGTHTQDAQAEDALSHEVSIGRHARKVVVVSKEYVVPLIPVVLPGKFCQLFPNAPGIFRGVSLHSRDCGGMGRGRVAILVTALSASTAGQVSRV